MPERANRQVAYASRRELEASIYRQHGQPISVSEKRPAPSRESPARKPPNSSGIQQAAQAEATSPKPSEKKELPAENTEKQAEDKSHVVTMEDE